MTGGLATDPAALLPEAILLIGAAATLVTGIFSARDWQWTAWLVALAGALGSIVAAAFAAGTHRLVYGASYAIDLSTTIGRITVGGATVVALLLARSSVADSPRETEFYTLMMLGAAGSVALAGSSDLLLLAVSYLLASIPLYALSGWARDGSGAEAALKIYLIGALMSIIMLVGIVILTGTTGGATTYRAFSHGLGQAPHVAVALAVVAILAGLAFKMGAVPAHFWVPDAVSGATVPAAAYLTTIPKIGGLLAAYRLLSAISPDIVNWPLLVAILAAASMTLGNLAAFAQQQANRLLAYSTISQVGYLMMAVAVAGRARSALPALGLYLGAYAITNIGAFAVLAAQPARRSLHDWRGVGRSNPLLIGALAVCLLGLVGIPPTAVFFGKLTVFTAAWDGGMSWLVIVAAVNTVASLYYYVRWLAPAALPDDGERTALAEGIPSPWPTRVAFLCGAGALVASTSGFGLFNASAALMR